MRCNVENDFAPPTIFVFLSSLTLCLFVLIVLVLLLLLLLTMQAFINELKKQDTSRSFLHVHCGNVTSSSLMAQALRKQAMQFPPWRDAAFVVSVVLSFSDSQPWMLKIVAPIREWLLKNARDLSSQQILADKFMEEISPENKANDLSYVLRQYQFLFENTPAGGKKPVIILGNYDAFHIFFLLLLLLVSPFPGFFSFSLL